MNNSKVLLKVEDFRAIGKAEIKLDGITVVAGVNGCGKSTLSKLLYWVYRGATDFKVLADTKLNNDLGVIYRLFTLSMQSIQHTLLENSKNDFDTYIKKVSELMLLRQNWDLFFEKKNNNQKEINIFFNEVKDKLSEIGVNEEYHNAKAIFDVLRDIFKENNMPTQEIDVLDQENDLSKINILDTLFFTTNYVFDNYKHNISQKPRFFLDEKIKGVFHTKYTPTLLEISENELPIFKTDYEFLSEPYWIDNVIYIDTPMFFQNSGTEHWNDVNEKLKIRPELYQQKSTITEIDDLIKKEVLTGNAEIKFDELSGSFIFKTSSGAEIDLSDSATGIKAFAVLNLLLKNKSINDKTLLILDEPEAHLHPQWIIEFGRLLTLIHKYIGAKVFVATHSPDMVQALRYIPNKEEIGEKVNFYLAKANESGQFDYQDLNGEIDEIFSSFNLSLDKLNKYGED